MTPTTDRELVTLEVLTQPAPLPAGQSPRFRKIGFSEITQTRETTTDGDGWEHYAYTIRLRCGGRRMESPWRAGIANVTKRGVPKPPTAADVLETMLLDASGYDSAHGFEDWALEYGYDTDSRKAEELYHVVRHQTENLAALLAGRPWKDSTDDAKTLARRLAGEEVQTDG